MENQGQIVMSGRSLAQARGVGLQARRAPRAESPVAACRRRMPGAGGGPRTPISGISLFRSKTGINSLLSRLISPLFSRREFVL